MKEFKSTKEIKKFHEGNNKKFFDPDTLRWFNSRILHGVVHGRIFFTSERDSYRDSNPRRYTVRMILQDRSIISLGGFDGFATNYEARKWAKALPKQLPSAIDCALRAYFGWCCWSDRKEDHGPQLARDFFGLAEIEKRNGGAPDHHSFVGSCDWLASNYELLKVSHLEQFFTKTRQHIGASS